MLSTISENPSSSAVQKEIDSITEDMRLCDLTEAQIDNVSLGLIHVYFVEIYPQEENPSYFDINYLEHDIQVGITGKLTIAELHKLLGQTEAEPENN